MLARSDDRTLTIRPEHLMRNESWSCIDIVQKLADPAAETDGLIVDERRVGLRP
jgi:hypothetical protein